LRSRSTIIRFSARAFGSDASCSLSKASSAAVLPRGIVPLIGFASILPCSSMLRNRSGDAQAMVTFPKSRKAAYGAGLAERSRR